MKFSGINYESLADGDGVRVSFFVSGCNRHCPGCFNKEAQDFDYGEDFTEETFSELIEHLEKPYVAGLTLLGGEPMDNAEELWSILYQLKTKYYYDTGKKLNVWLYTGYTIEELEHATEYQYVLLAMCDVVVDGPFIEAERDISLPFRGSRNQRICKIELRENAS